MPGPSRRQFMSPIIGAYAVNDCGGVFTAMLVLFLQSGEARVVEG
jgi:hypothetical protein